MLKKISVLMLAILIGVVGVFAQQDPQTRTLTSGQKYKIKGVVVAKDDSSFVVRDGTGVDTKVAIAPNTSIKTKGGVFGGGDKIASSQIVRGLTLEVEGRGDSAGMLAADKVRFGKDDFRVAQSIDSRVSPAETRLTQTEENQQRLSGQMPLAVVQKLHRKQLMPQLQALMQQIQEFRLWMIMSFNQQPMLISRSTVQFFRLMPKRSLIRLRLPQCS
jgi:hypothetical protein